MASPPSKKTSSDYKFIEVTHARKSGNGRRSGVIIILLKLFSSKLLILSIGVFQFDRYGKKKEVSVF